MLRHSLAALAAVCLLSGCLSTKSYVDTRLNDLNWSAVQSTAQAHQANLEVEFYRNGKRHARADKAAHGAVERALQKSGVVTLSESEAPVRLNIGVDNIADLSDAAGKGFLTGLTFGGKGSTVTDAYRITIRMSHGEQSVAKTYEHSLHTTIGNAQPTTPATPMTPIQAFDQVIEDAIIHFIRDAQADGLLVLQQRAQPVLG